jgi:hypothetical protein
MIRRILRDERGEVRVAARPPIAAPTLRKDAWWALPVTVVVVLLSFIIYSTWAALQNAYYYAPPYLSPFYSPCISVSCLHSTFGYGLTDIQLPIIGLVSPAFLILWGPGLFRLTCYYYRKAYYRSFWLSPPACAVAEPHARYTGETRFPLLLQNAHRYFFYIAVLISLINTYDAIVAFHGRTGGFGLGLGNLVLLGNVVLLWAYTLSCHSCRHITAGRINHFSRHPVRYRLWQWVSRLNRHHMGLAWTTLASLVVTDLYIALVSAGVLTDLRLVD